ncbi:N-acetyl-gamma-glutamyl-phosphate reductase [Ursidibacter maritimus]|uniref:N-acetyl-gamma-glutamyl-phosphate reductase n=1 Tax=Ursidibacter maritimus TaxID=1331689 RepID=UPI001C468AB9|nr:N-acetyl-gamma-glutamyl-phosphate reductase [Ursidibacter maritimus]MBV6541059.1 N-acetyl-gamma-glutamyl-phosphate reductase [Ursidibacter maritimus]
MQKYQVFIDGSVGTTGLRIYERLAQSDDIILLSLAEEQRKDINARIALMHQADLTFLCLPDEAAKEIVQYALPHNKICDTSTAHRTHKDWVYGFPELGQQREKIQQATRVAIPGCHATGFLALIRPLVELGLLNADYPVSCHSLTGYSGGGKQMIADYQASERTNALSAPRLYGLGLSHKHLPEMQQISGMSAPPMFCPVVDDYYSGMLVSVVLPRQAFNLINNVGEQVATQLKLYYQGSPLITVHPYGEHHSDGTLSANQLSGKDNLEIFILGNEHQILLCAQFDNLGKGASGAAIQCMNLLLGRTETLDLVF